MSAPLPAEYLAARATLPKTTHRDPASVASFAAALARRDAARPSASEIAAAVVQRLEADIADVA